LKDVKLYLLGGNRAAYTLAETWAPLPNAKWHVEPSTWRHRRSSDWLPALTSSSYQGPSTRNIYISF